MSWEACFVLAMLIGPLKLATALIPELTGTSEMKRKLGHASIKELTGYKPFSRGTGPCC